MASSFQGLPRGLLPPLGLTLGPCLLGALVTDLSQLLWKSLEGKGDSVQWGGVRAICWSGVQHGGGLSLAFYGVSPSLAA